MLIVALAGTSMATCDAAAAISMEADERRFRFVRKSSKNDVLHATSLWFSYLLGCKMPEHFTCVRKNFNQNLLTFIISRSFTFIEERLVKALAR